MARTPVQGYTGLSVSDCLEQHGTEDHCFDALYAWRRPQGIRCPHCGHDRCGQLSERTLQQCTRCHRHSGHRWHPMGVDHSAIDSLGSGDGSDDPGHEGSLGDKAA